MTETVRYTLTQQQREVIIDILIDVYRQSHKQNLDFQSLALRRTQSIEKLALQFEINLSDLSPHAIIEALVSILEQNSDKGYAADLMLYTKLEPNFRDR